MWSIQNFLGHLVQFFKYHMHPLSIVWTQRYLKNPFKKWQKRLTKDNHWTSFYHDETIFPSKQKTRQWLIYEILWWLIFKHKIKHTLTFYSSATHASLYIERKSSLLSLLILSTPPTTIPDERGKLGFGLRK